MSPKLIDAHAHVNFAAFDMDRDEVIKRALEAGIWLVNVGTDLKTSTAAVALAQKYETGVFATVGLHPVHTGPSYHDQAEGQGDQPETEFDFTEYLKLAKDNKVVGIGECGLDYFHAGEEAKVKQTAIFREQIRLAKEVAKPLMLHLRSGKDGLSAYTDALAILQAEKAERGDVHFFAGTMAEAETFLDLGFYLSFTGVLTFTTDYDEVVKFVPLDRILVETDCPYVAPVPYRGKRNEPLYVEEMAKAVARIKGLSLEEVSRQTTLNWQALFGLSNGF
ncbi:MAG: hypothetical protein A2571_01175 [Candidatus Vogelbacteria bacterium RIFOXYD1_FULL_44_32]|uniref:Hydrolase TatD n=1 Tax=Candidatus Vogelbacteria bacterium RIFOXYD1_FULL_44_32 TaxID=1802438 RepID=A0A1G2QG74_9BACT|nr:MAG: hypothetical protein A2571_01175 [Candidatus Vogelbacteria bacterium RIFOXYD1_FULL_44_32]